MPIKDLRNTTETRINRIDQATYESEQEMANGAEAIDAEVVFAELEKSILDKHQMTNYLQHLVSNIQSEAINYKNNRLSLNH